MTNVFTNVLLAEVMSRSILISSRTVHSGRVMLESLLRHRWQKNWQIIYFNFDVVPQQLIEELPNVKVKIYSCYGCILKNENSTLNIINFDELKNAEIFLPHFLEENCLLVINSLNSIILEQGLNYVCLLLNNWCCLSTLDTILPKLQILSLFVEEGFDDYHKQSLSRYHQTILSLSSIHTILNCHIMHKQYKGKLISEKKQIMIFLNYNLQENKCQNEKQIRELNSANIFENLSFRLNLSDKEKHDRDELILSYIRKQERFNDDTNETEDWDSDDLDNDLDI